MSQEPSFKVADSIEAGDIVVDVLEWTEFAGMTNLAALNTLFQLRQANLPLRQVRLTCRKKSEVILEAGALQFYYGHFETENKFPVRGALRRAFGSFASGEKLFRPAYHGAGIIWLEPSFGNYLILGLDNETIIVDQGMFLCCSGEVEVSSVMQSTISAAFWGGEGLYQTQLTGSGFVVLSSPCPESEIIKMKVTKNRRVVVDGSFALLRSGGVKFYVTRSSRTWLGTAYTGEGLLQTFDGEGDVWVAPMLPVYDVLGAATGYTDTNAGG